MTRLCQVATAVLGALLLAAAGPVAPTIGGGQILTTTVNVTQPPPAPRVKLDIIGPADSVFFTWTGPSSQTLGSYFTGSLWNGSTVFQAYNTATPEGSPRAFNLYSQPGQWHLSNLFVCRSGLCTGYGGGQLSELILKTGFQLTNPNHWDITPPTASAATITTPTISLRESRAAHISLTARDNLSGMYTASVELDAPGVATSIVVSAALASAAVRRVGTFTLSSVLPASTAPGTYTVTRVDLQDYAGNTNAYLDSGQFATLFGGKTTITVTP